MVQPTGDSQQIVPPRLGSSKSNMPETKAEMCSGKFENALLELIRQGRYEQSFTSSRHNEDRRIER
jgi:hypothetical protein